ncbi:MAG: carboxylate--amine ligase, partial [Bacteroidota bacterium]
YGLEAEIILDETGKTSLLRKEIESLLVELEPIASTLGTLEELKSVRRMLEQGPSYVRQRSTFEEKGTFLSVAEMLVQEFKERKPLFGK